MSLFKCCKNVWPKSHTIVSHGMGNVQKRFSVLHLQNSLYRAQQLDREALCGNYSDIDRMLMLTLCQELEAGDAAAHPKTKHNLQGP